MNRKILSSLLAGTAIATLFNLPRALADEAELYDLAPPGSSFIRIINLTTNKISATIDQKKMSATDYCQAGNYIFLPPGPHQISYAGKSFRSHLKTDTVYSLVIGSDQHHFLQQKMFTDRNKGMISVYNLTHSDKISIKTTKKQQQVFNDITPLQKKNRHINPLRVELSAFNNTGKLMDIDPVIFQRGKNTSLFICNYQQNHIARWSND